MMCYRYYCSVARGLAALGAINWGAVAFLKFNFVDYLDVMFGRIGLDMVLYALIALSGLCSLFCLCFSCKICKK